MPNSAKLQFNEIDKSFGVPSLIKGIVAAQARTLRGPFGHDGNIYTNWAEFSKKYGGEVQGMEGPTQIKRLLDRGGAVRLNKVGHYTTISDPGTLDAVKATFAAGLGKEGSDAYFLLTMKYEGVDYNFLSAVISAASNGNANSFDLTISHSEEPRLTEIFPNLTITGTPNVAGSDYLSDVIANSLLVDVTYLDASGFTGPLRPDNGTFAASGGNDGGVGATAQIDTLSLAGTSGTATISGPGGLSLTATFATSLTVTASNFVTANAAAYLAEGIVLTDSTGDLIFTANVAGTPHDHPTATNLTGDLTGTNVITAANVKGGPDNNDYIGDAAGTGFNIFDGYNDFNIIACLDNYVAAVHIGGASYTNNRQDCVYFAHLDNSHNTAALLQTERALITTDTKYLYICAGGLEIIDPFTPSTGSVVPTIEIAEIADVCGIAARSEAEFGEWISFAGVRRGLFFNALDVVNNFGNDTTLMDSLAQRQINMAVNRDGRMFLSGNFSGQLASSRKSFMNVVKLNIFIKKSLRPLLELYLEEPNDFPTFKDIFNAADPFLEGLASRDLRALLDYAWRGDQDAVDDAQLSINTRADLDQGKYKVELYIKEIVSLQTFTIDIISSPSGVSFEDQ